MGFFGLGSFLGDIAVDNSKGGGGAGEGEQGRLYVSEAEGPVHAFTPAGEWLWTLSGKAVMEGTCGIAVDQKGHLWVANRVEKKVFEFDATGKVASPAAPIGEFQVTHGNGRGCRLAIDNSGKGFYVGLLFGAVGEYVDGSFDSTLSPQDAFDITIDQSQQGGRVFAVGEQSLREYEPCEAPGCAGSEVAHSPFGGDLIGAGRGIAYNPSLDWVYVSDDASNTVKVFGPETNGTAPDVSCESVDGVGLHSATVQCTINPLGLPNSYHFEVKEGTGSNWGAAEPQPASYPSIEPTDSSPHSVSLKIETLNGKILKSNTTFQVRLAGTNAEPDKMLSGYSNPVSFTTLKPPPPSITNCSTSAIDEKSAHFACVIDAQAEETTWRAEKSIDPACATGFAQAPLQTIPGEEPAPVEVGWDLEGLSSAQHYCARLSATGPGGTTMGPVEEFKTLAIPPSDVGAAFAAPRTDTTARISARVNPNGVDLTYRFELSADGGATWTPLPERTSTLGAREQILVAEELSGLAPETSYRYRLALAENEAGPAASLGEEKTFTTRSTAEAQAIDPPGCPNEDVRQKQHADSYLGSCRGIELVNNPDKGNQNAFALQDVGASPMSASGEKVFWGVGGGAPKAPNGTGNPFLAERSASGWGSQAIAPPASQQLGGGELGHALLQATPDFSTYAFNVRRSTVLVTPDPPNLSRVHRGAPEELLKAYEVQPVNATYEGLVDISDDGEHVVFPDNQTLQLEDIGIPGAAEVLSLMPDGLPSSCGLEVENGESFRGATGPNHWIATTDASRVYFLARPNKAAPNEEECEASAPLGLYVRNREAAQTTPIDPGVKGEDLRFIRATPDGRQAYLLTHSPLDPADEDEGADVYRWDEAAGSSACLTCVDPRAADLLVNQINGTPSVLVSDDFSHVYFESAEQLVPGLGKAGARNLYVLHEGAVGFIGAIGGGVLASADIRQLSGDGNVLLFEAPATPALSADAMGPACVDPGSHELGACRQLYRYDDRDGSLECVSCAHEGATTHSIGTAAGLTGISFSLSGDGETIAFATQEPLAPTDVNQDTDIYEWRQGGLGLITDGVSDFQVEITAPQVRAVDEDGSDILFAVVPPGGKLTGFEQDELLNIYDARIGGGFEPPSPEPGCIEDSCQGPLQPAPRAEQPASVGSSRGNLPPRRKPRPCARKRGKAKRRCVAAQRKHRRNRHAHMRRASHKRGGTR